MRCPSCGRLYASSERFCSHDGIALESYQPDDPLVGTELLGRYQVLRPLGRGGMGVVYLAQQKGIGRTVACKVLAAERSVDPTARQRFEREARLIAEMRSPHTVALYDFGAADDGRLVLVMEHVEGETLRAILNREGALPVDRAATLVEQVARSLTEAHTRGVVHRDIKPSNVLSAPTPDYPDLVKVVDFGIAALVDERDATRLTITEEAPGTPTYMAPECVAGETPDARADVYALGVLLFEMIAGRPPFVGGSAQEVMTAQLEAEVPLLSDVAETPLPDGVVTLVARCLAKQRALRPRDAGEFREALGIAMGWSEDGRAMQRISDATLPRVSRKAAAPKAPKAAPASVKDDLTLERPGPQVATNAPLPDVPPPPTGRGGRPALVWASVAGAAVLVATVVAVVTAGSEPAATKAPSQPPTAESKKPSDDEGVGTTSESTPPTPVDDLRAPARASAAPGDTAAPGAADARSAAEISPAEIPDVGPAEAEAADAAQPRKAASVPTKASKASSGASPVKKKTTRTKKAKKKADPVAPPASAPKTNIPSEAYDWFKRAKSDSDAQKRP